VGGASSAVKVTVNGRVLVPPRVALDDVQALGVRVRVFRMWPAVREDLSVAVNVRFEQEEDVSGIDC
jgi:hypothetical protein